MPKAKSVEEFDKLLKNIPDSDRPKKKEAKAKPAKKLVEKSPYAVYAMGLREKKYKKIVEREEFKNTGALMSRVRDIVENKADVSEVIIHVS